MKEKRAKREDRIDRESSKRHMYKNGIYNIDAVLSLHGFKRQISHLLSTPASDLYFFSSFFLPPPLYSFLLFSFM